MSAYTVLPIDYIFDFATTNLAAGATARMGNRAADMWRVANNQASTAYPLAAEQYGEIAGVEIFPGISGGLYERYGYVRVVVDRIERDTINNTELTAPGYRTGFPNPLHGAGMRMGMMPTNFGKPMLMGEGNALEACPKVGPGETIDVVVQASPLAALTQMMKVRVWVAIVDGEKKLIEVLKHYKHISGNGGIDCSFGLGDLERTETMPLRSVEGGNPIPKVVGSGPGGAFTGSDWTALPGGNDQQKPVVHPFMIQSNNAVATPTTDWYQHTQDNARVSNQYNVLQFKFDKKDAVLLTHVGVLNDGGDHLRNLRLWRSGRSIENVYEVQLANNPFPMPSTRNPGAMQISGPGVLPKPWLVWYETGSIETRADGTAIPAYSLIDGYDLAVWGKRFELDGVDAK